MTEPIPEPRVAGPDDAGEIAGLLHDFNVEFDTPSPGPEPLRARLRELLAGDATLAVVAGTPAVAVALITLRPNVWYSGPVALLDEMYVRPAQRGLRIGSGVLDRVLELVRSRGVELVEINVDEADRDALRFYQRHGFTAIEPTTGERAFYVHQELSG